LESVMNHDDAVFWKPFRPDTEEVAAIARDVSEIPAIQKRLVEKCPSLHNPDRVAHEYQIAGGKVRLRITDTLPVALNGIGLFEPGAEYVGIGRISTGMGSAHLETNPDFLGLMVAFETRSGDRVDFLAINDPTAPTDDHREFMDVLHATAESAGAEIPLIGDWGDYDAGNFIAEQYEFGRALADRMGLLRAGRCLAHLFKQTSRTFNSSTAYQHYWTGIEEVGDIAAKFEFVPLRNDNHHPGFRPGERHLTEEWKERQIGGDIEFDLYWIPFLDEERTPTHKLTQPWQEEHKERIGAVIFPQGSRDSDEASLWGLLASEMGANPGNWVHDRENTITDPATEFGVARKIAYQASQDGRQALDPREYQSVFRSGTIGEALAGELRRREVELERVGQVRSAP
jgi:hypothetical protein